MKFYIFFIGPLITHIHFHFCTKNLRCRNCGQNVRKKDILTKFYEKYQLYTDKTHKNKNVLWPI